jgi:hypothetical protein
MKFRIIAFLSAALMLAPIAAAQSESNQPVDNKPILGVWRAQMNGLPAFTLVVTDESGSLTGAIQFYLQKREDANRPYTATPGLPEPIFNPKFDGKMLSFQVSHRHAHPPGTVNDPPITFWLKPIDTDKAQFIRLSDQYTMIITRSDY